MYRPPAKLVCCLSGQYDQKWRWHKRQDSDKRRVATAFEDCPGLYRAIAGPRAHRLTLAEFKLWRNPQARREVIGQILDYAKEIASWSYEDLQREVSRALKRPGNVLFDLVRATDPDVEEGVFVDNVTRHLRRGEFLLLIIGDGIREGVENIVDFVQQHSGLHFNLAWWKQRCIGTKTTTSLSSRVFFAAPKSCVA